MANPKRIFTGLLLLVLVLGSNITGRASTAQAPGVGGGSTVRQATTGMDRNAHLEIPDSYQQVAENENFILYADQATLAFKVLDKRSGYLWHSNLDEKADGDRLNKTWTAFAQSGITIDYLDPKAITERLSIANTNQTIEFRKTGQGFEAEVTFTDVAITIPVTVTLEPAGVVVDVPFAAIRQESPDYKLGILHVYPFMGATRADSIPGYMFIPDGCGSLIRFTAESRAKNMFYGRYYGVDLGMIGTIPWDPTINRPYKLSLPVIGMVHEEKKNAFIAVVEKGAAYGEIYAHPSGVITNFNFLYNAFTYNESYFQATNRSGAGVTTLQPETNAFDISIHYRFLTGEQGDYVGMARSYQQYLVDKGVLKGYPGQNNNIGIRLEFLGAEREKVLFWYRHIAMTTIEQVGDILEKLEISDPEVIYYGWQPLGASSMPPRTLQLERTLGTLEQMKTLIQEIEAKNGRFAFYLDPQAAITGEKGYSPRNDLAMSITNFNLEGYNRNPNFFLNMDSLNQRYSSLSSDVFSQMNAGLALDGIGSILYSDFKRGNFLNREQAIQKYQEMLAENGGVLSMYLPNDYFFGSISAYYGMPLGTSGYLYTTDSVPFLQIVLAGHIPYYGGGLNFSSNLEEDLLRHIDFGVYPSYFLTQEVTAKILNTDSNWIFTSSYAQWGDEVEQTYQWLNSLLGPVEGQEIISRQVLAESVYATTYANNKQIIVNYGNAPYNIGGIVVPGRNAVIREVTP